MNNASLKDQLRALIDMNDKYEEQLIELFANYATARELQEMGKVLQSPASQERTKKVLEILKEFASNFNIEKQEKPNSDIDYEYNNSYEQGGKSDPDKLAPMYTVLERNADEKKEEIRDIAL